MDTTTVRNGIAGYATSYVPVGNTPMAVCRELPQQLVGVWAHPDDEAYLSAGLMARVIAAGGQVTVVTATCGEHGTDDPELAGTARFGAHRRDELAASLAVLGVHDVRFLGLADGECDRANSSWAVDSLRDVLAEVEPDTVVTFGPDGITGHPDHQDVSAWTTVACRTFDTELLYATMTNDFVRRHHELHSRLGLFDDFGNGRPTSVATSGIALECSLNPHECGIKRRALAEHATQTTGLAQLMGEDVYVGWWCDETFRRPTWAERHAALTTSLIGAA
jgi:LmbE family N-acetylglucosaminyl deacetylase